MSGSVKLNLPAGGSKTISAPDSASDETITLPAGNATLSTFAGTGLDDVSGVARATSGLLFNYLKQGT